MDAQDDSKNPVGSVMVSSKWWKVVGASNFNRRDNQGDSSVSSRPFGVDRLAVVMPLAKGESASCNSHWPADHMLSCHLWWCGLAVAEGAVASRSCLGGNHS